MITKALGRIVCAEIRCSWKFTEVSSYKEPGTVLMFGRCLGLLVLSQDLWKVCSTMSTCAKLHLPRAAEYAARWGQNAIEHAVKVEPDLVHRYARSARVSARAAASWAFVILGRPEGERKGPHLTSANIPNFYELNYVDGKWVRTLL